MKLPGLDVFPSAYPYQKLRPSLEEKQIPVYLPDLSFLDSGLFALSVSDMLLPTTELLLGYEALRKISWEKPISRRDFLKIGVTGLVAFWLLTPLPIEMVKTIALGLDKGVAGTLKLDKLFHRAHPELNLMGLALRNTVIAHKEEWVAENLLRKNQNLVTVIGAFHTGIEDAILCSPERRLRFLRNLRPLLKTTVIPEAFYTTPKLVYEKNHWQIEKVFEIPELKEIILGSQAP